MKKITLFAGLFVILITSYLILQSQKYSTLDITADNFKDILKDHYDKKLDLRTIGIDNCLPENQNAATFLPLSLETADILYKDENNYFNKNRLEIKREENSKCIKLNIYSSNTILNYTVFFQKPKKNLSSVIVFSQYQNQLIKTIVDKLIINEGFILKKSNLKNGHDIIIKETDNNFIIGELFNTYEPDYPLQLILSSYDKRKFF